MHKHVSAQKLRKRRGKIHSKLIGVVPSARRTRREAGGAGALGR